MSIRVITDERDILDLAKRMRDVRVMAFDLEFSPLNPHDNSRLFLISIAFGGNAYVIDYTKVQKLDPILPYLSDKKVLKIGHNIGIDIKFTWHHLKTRMQNVYCTMVSEQILTAGIDVEEIEYIDHDGKKKKSMFNLAALLWRRFGIQLEKEKRNIFVNYDGSPFTQEAYDYAGKDTLYLEKIYNEQMEEIREKELDRVIKLEMRLVPYVAFMEYEGVYFNYDKCIEALPVTDKIIARMERWLQDLLISQGVATNITFDGDTYYCTKLTSWQQVLVAFNKIGVNVKKTDKDALKEWDFRNGFDWNEKNKQHSEWVFDDDQTGEFDIAYVNVVLRHYAVIKALDKFKGTYLEGLRDKYHAPTGKVYPSFLQCGARATGRFSSNSPNFQNLIKPKSLKAIGLGEYDVRAMCYAPKGYKLVQLDYEGIELVLLAIISGDTKLQASILSDDTHKVVTSMIARSFGLELPEGYKKKQPFETFRDCAKTKTYARIYGSGVPNVLRKLSIPIAIAGYKLKREHVQSWFDEWANEYPLAAHALEAAANDAVTKGYVTTVLGRRRQWDLSLLTADKMKLWGAMREGANSRVQGSAADLLKLAAVRIMERLDTEKAAWIMQIHDELVFISREEYAEECGDLAQREMIKAGTILFGDVANGLIKTDPMILDKYTK